MPIKEQQCPKNTDDHIVNQTLDLFFTRKAEGQPLVTYMPHHQEPGQIWEMGGRTPGEKSWIMDS